MWVSLILSVWWLISLGGMDYWLIRCPLLPAVKHEDQTSSSLEMLLLPWVRQEGWNTGASRAMERGGPFPNCVSAMVWHRGAAPNLFHQRVSTFLFHHPWWSFITYKRKTSRSQIILEETAWVTFVKWWACAMGKGQVHVGEGGGRTVERSPWGEQGTSWLRGSPKSRAKIREKMSRVACDI